MFTIRKQFEFSAAHQLYGLPPDHQCARKHGHNYCVEVVLAAQTLDATGFVVDYGELKALREHLDKYYEHRDLNDFYEQPCAELIARELFRFCKTTWPQTTMVRVSETSKTWAEYSSE
jgi:6-pyruvoyltetrahydropterin/6-carboxytetrahydropterin synthase